MTFPNNDKRLLHLCAEGPLQPLPGNRCCTTSGVVSFRCRLCSSLWMLSKFLLEDSWLLQVDVYIT